MKDLNPTNWIFWFGILTIISMLLPVAAILIRQQFRLSFIALIIYLLFTFFYNFLMLLFPTFPLGTRRAIGVLSNYIDAPLIMIFLLYLTYNKTVLRVMKLILTGYMIFETIVVLIFGFSIKSITI